MKKTVYENPWFRVIQDGQMHWIEEPRADVSAAVLITLNGTDVLLVRAKRPLHGGEQLEIPRGYAEAGETALQCAMREVREETGLEVYAAELRELGKYQPNSALLASEITLFHADIHREVTLADHDTEVTGVLSLSMDDLKQRIGQGRIKDGFTLAAMLMLGLGA